MEDHQELQNKYSQLCGQRGHLESQIWVAQSQMEEFDQLLQKNMIELKDVIKKINELQRKAAYDSQKAAEEKKAS